MCHACQIQHPTNNKKVEIAKRVVKEIPQDDKLFDFKPSLHNGRLMMYAPTTKDPKQFLEVKSLKFRDGNNVTEIAVDVYRATVRDIKNRLKPEERKEGYQTDRISLFFEKEINDERVKKLYTANP